METGIFITNLESHFTALDSFTSLGLLMCPCS
jgi:hypothetical protein